MARGPGRSGKNSGRRIPASSRTGPRKSYLVVLGALAAAVGLSVALLLFGVLGGGEKTTEERVFANVKDWNSESSDYRDRLEELAAEADRAVEAEDDGRLARISSDGDVLGREISKFRIRISRVQIPEDPDLHNLKDQTTQVVSYLAEAAENLQVIAEAPAGLRRDLLSQARRLVVLADTSMVWLDAYWQHLHGLGDRKLMESHPLVDDSSLREAGWTENFGRGLNRRIEPWQLSGVPASEVGSRATGDIGSWVDAEREAAYRSEITTSISAACAELEIFARADSDGPDPGAMVKAFEANRDFSNFVAAADPPKDAPLLYAAAWRGVRSWNEALLTALVSDEMGHLRRRWLFKAYRLAVLSGASWNQGLTFANREQLPFGYTPSCQGRLDVLFLSPWDVRQDLTTVIPGPRAYG